MFILILSLCLGAALAAPSIAVPFQEQIPPIARVSQEFHFELSPNTFGPYPEALYFDLSIYSQPSWLKFDPTTRQFSGTPSATDVGTFEFDLVATDISTPVAMRCQLKVVDQAGPEVHENPIDPVARTSKFTGTTTILVAPSSPIYIELVEDAFDSTWTNLSYYVTLAGDSTLPSWLSFDAKNLILSGQAPEVNGDNAELHNIRFIASDTPGFSSAEIPYTLIVSNRTFEFFALKPGVTIKKGQTVNLENLRDMLRLDGQPLSDMVETAVSAHWLPEWLTFDWDESLVSGTPPSDTDNVTFSIEALDEYRHYVNTTLTLSFVDSLFTKDIGPFDASVGQTLNSTIDPSSFEDNLDISISADPSYDWLKFDSRSLTLSGDVPADLQPRDLEFSIIAASPYHPSTREERPVTLRISESSIDEQAARKSSRRATTIIIVFSVLGVLILIGLKFIHWYIRRQKKAMNANNDLEKNKLDPRHSDEIDQWHDTYHGRGIVGDFESQSSRFSGFHSEENASLVTDTSYRPVLRGGAGPSSIAASRRSRGSRSVASLAGSVGSARSALMGAYGRFARGGSTRLPSRDSQDSARSEIPEVPDIPEAFQGFSLDSGTRLRKLTLASKHSKSKSSSGQLRSRSFRGSLHRKWSSLSQASHPTRAPSILSTSPSEPQQNTNRQSHIRKPRNQRFTPSPPPEYSPIPPPSRSCSPRPNPTLNGPYHDFDYAHSDREGSFVTVSTFAGLNAPPRMHPEHYPSNSYARSDRSKQNNSMNPTADRESSSLWQSLSEVEPDSFLGRGPDPDDADDADAEEDEGDRRPLLEDPSLAPRPLQPRASRSDLNLVPETPRIGLVMRPTSESDLNSDGEPTSNRVGKITPVPGALSPQNSKQTDARKQKKAKKVKKAASQSTITAQMASVPTFQPTHKPAKHVHSESDLRSHGPSRPLHMHPINGPPEPVTPNFPPPQSLSTTPLLFHRISRDALAAMPALPEAPADQDPSDQEASSRAVSLSLAHHESHDTINSLPTIPYWQYNSSRQPPSPPPSHATPLWRPPHHIEAEKKAEAHSTLQVPTWRPKQHESPPTQQPPNPDSTPLWRPKQHENPTHRTFNPSALPFHTHPSRTNPTFTNATPRPPRRPSIKVSTRKPSIRRSPSHASTRRTTTPRPVAPRLSTSSTLLSASVGAPTASPMQRLKQVSMMALKKDARRGKVEKVGRTKSRVRSERLREARRGIRGQEKMEENGVRWVGS